MADFVGQILCSCDAVRVTLASVILGLFVPVEAIQRMMYVWTCPVHDDVQLWQLENTLSCPYADHVMSPVTIAVLILLPFFFGVALFHCLLSWSTA